jgi:hypothetical protein
MDWGFQLAMEDPMRPRDPIDGIREERKPLRLLRSCRDRGMDGLMEAPVAVAVSTRHKLTGRAVSNLQQAPESTSEAPLLTVDERAAEVVWLGSTSWLSVHCPPEEGEMRIGHEKCSETGYGCLYEYESRTGTN